MGAKRLRKAVEQTIQGQTPWQEQIQSTAPKPSATPTQKSITYRIEKETCKAKHFLERLGDGVVLDMVLILGGSFLMGSPEDELERRDPEGPQHRVTVPPFWMGRYPVTQAQWRMVAQMDPVNQSLEPEPSGFKGDELPVEQVSWHDAQEFCARLSRQTGRGYRLPSEAEWEYACRAGTTTPFHFGETISTDLANYDGTDDSAGNWSGSYGRGPKGEYRQKTTPVGRFGVANDFGLYDMHGNVWEWCEDEWHGNYRGAPTDGSAWVTAERGQSDEDRDNTEKKIDEDESERSRVLRGGSWIGNPRICRSAYRDYSSPGIRYGIYGFRVVCVAARTHLDLYTS